MSPSSVWCSPEYPVYSSTVNKNNVTLRQPPEIRSLVMSELKKKNPLVRQTIRPSLDTFRCVLRPLISPPLTFLGLFSTTTKFNT